MELQIESNVDLRPYNTFKISSTAKHLVRIKNVSDVKQLINEPVFKSNAKFILGGGSNILLLDNYDGLVIKSEENSVRIVKENENGIHIKVAAGVVWHSFVLQSIENSWGGIENLSLIPGTVGAAPIQNIGAYGVEVKDLIENVEAIDLSNGNNLSFTNEDCKFSYRESIFKHELKEKIFISSVTLRLTKKNHHINSDYEALKKVLIASNITHPTIKDVSKTVIDIRRSKLPDPNEIGNAGSFFKNPVIDSIHLKSLQNQYPSIPFYSTDNQLFKVPAGWLIENCNWKGKRIDKVGVHKNQALVLVNYADAKGSDIKQLSQRICDDVKDKFNIILTPEVNFITSK